MLENLVATYGLLAIFLGSAVEGETVAFLGGISAHRHLLAYLPAALAASAGSFLADQAFFFAGRYARHFRYVRGVADSELGRKVTAARDIAIGMPRGAVIENQGGSLCL